MMLLRPRENDYQDHHPGAGDVLLLVELSESSLVYDRGTKLAALRQVRRAGSLDC
jgi:hypothetical protein